MEAFYKSGGKCSQDLSLLYDVNQVPYDCSHTPWWCCMLKVALTLNGTVIKRDLGTKGAKIPCSMRLSQ